MPAMVHFPSRHSSTASKSTSTSSGSVDETASSLSTLNVKDPKHGHHTHHKHARRHAPPSEPIEFCSEALYHLFTYPGAKSSKTIPMEELFDEILPQYYHPDYIHRVNNRVESLEHLRGIVSIFRERFHTVRVLIRSSIMDTDGSSSLAKGAVAMQYQIVVEQGPMKEEVRTNCVTIVRLRDGKLETGDVIVDTQPFKEAQKDLSCIIS